MAGVLPDGCTAKRRRSLTHDAVGSLDEDLGTPLADAVEVDLRRGRARDPDRS